MTPRVIRTVVAKHYGVTLEKMMTRRLYREVRARQMAMYVMRTLLKMSLPQIGAEFKKDHTTVLHGVREVAEKIERQDGTHRDYEAIATMVQGTQVAACPHCLRPFESESLLELREDMERLQRRIDAVTTTRAA